MLRDWTPEELEAVAAQAKQISDHFRKCAQVIRDAGLQSFRVEATTLIGRIEQCRDKTIELAGKFGGLDARIKDA